MPPEGMSISELAHRRRQGCDWSLVYLPYGDTAPGRWRMRSIPSIEAGGHP